MEKTVNCRREELALLKKLDNGEYMNLTDLDFEFAKNANNMYYDVDDDSDYILMLTPYFDQKNEGNGASFYVPVSLDDLVPYAPSVKKIKRTRISDVIIATLMSENKSLRYRVTYDTEDVMSNHVEVFLRVKHDMNKRTEEEDMLKFDNVYAEEL